MLGFRFGASDREHPRDASEPNFLVWGLETGTTFFGEFRMPFCWNVGCHGEHAVTVRTPGDAIQTSFGFGVWSLGCGVLGLGVGINCVGFLVSGFGSRISVLGVWL